MSACKGNGECLEQISERTYIVSQCAHDCEPQRCPNFIVCRTTCPQWVLDCNHGTCMSCAIEEWDLKTQEDEDCSTCFKRKVCVTNPHCDHMLCGKCFRKIYCARNVWKQPRFPYPKDVEDEYDNDPDCAKWKNDPLISKYIEQFDLCERMNDLEDELLELIAKCPICGK
jgi:hypothetical protein